MGGLGSFANVRYLLSSELGNITLVKAHHSDIDYIIVLFTVKNVKNVKNVTDKGFQY